MIVFDGARRVLHTRCMKYVSIYKRARSPYWWLRYYDPTVNKKVAKSSGIRIDDIRGRVRALDMARELSQTAIAQKPLVDNSGWESWVTDYFVYKYSYSPTTLKRVLGGWKVLRAFLSEKKVNAPAGVQYKHAQEWIEWRMRMKKHCGTFIKKNTAIAEFRFFTMLLREAARRGFILASPLERMGISKDKAKVKPEITPKQDKKILAALETKPEWMKVSYQVAMAQGCRLRETQVPLEDIHEARGVIVFDAKGDNLFATKLHPSLLPLVARKRAEGAARLCELPRMASKDWCFFFDSLGLPEHSFHCTRVTVITQLARAGVPIQQAMAFIGHADATIHGIYRRLSPQDLGAATDALSRPASNGTPETPGALQSNPPRPSHGRSARRGRGSQAAT